MRDGYWFAPETEENSFLNSFALGKNVTVEVRIAKNVYRNDSSGYSVYEVENSDHRWFKVSGFFPTEMSIDTYYIIEGTVKKRALWQRIIYDQLQKCAASNEGGDFDGIAHIAKA